jgi:hypothetical protein
MQSPAISIVVVTDAVDALADLIAHLDAQTLRDRLELVVVAPRETPRLWDGRAAGRIGAVKAVEVQSLTPISAARAAGIRAAAAPFVFLGETHSFPEAGWAEALLEAHDEGWDCVVPTFTNANPGGAVSWGAFLLAFGQHAAAVGVVELDAVPVHSCSWRRSVLTTLAADPDLLEPGSALNERLQQSGARACRSPDARLAHLNAARFRVALAERFLLGRVIAANRARRWPLLRRIMYLAASPLLPAVLVLRGLRGLRLRALPPLTLPVMLAAATAQTVGEAVGYAAGVGDSAARLAAYELSRGR